MASKNPFIGTLKDELIDFWNNFSGKTSKEIAEKNFNLQQEQFDYQKKLNDILMEREDTAYQRAVKDAQSAGLSAQGIAGSSSSALSSGNAPQINDYASNDYQNGLNLLNSLTQFENNIQQNIISRKRAEADIRKTNAETADIEARTDLFNYQLPYLKVFTDFDFTDRNNKNNYLSKYGSFTGANPYQEYALIKGLNNNQYADIIRTNEFDKIGMIFSIIQDLGKGLGINNIKDVKDTLNTMPKLFNNFDSLNPILSNNNIVLPESLNSFFHRKNREDKLSDKKATQTQDTLNDIRKRDDKGISRKQNKKGKF